ncbi:MAG: adenylate/guanylate cyclase domain-containing protein [Gammaproteobacteria bacterium]
MNTPDSQRRLQAVLAADVAGFTRLMAADETATVANLNASRQLFRTHLEAHRGRVVDTAGDSILAVFDSVVDATSAAVAAQEAQAAANAARPAAQRMDYRVGINLGDLISHGDGTVYGDGVNLAARVQSLAVPGAIALSSRAHALLDGTLKSRCRDGGEQAVKGSDTPLRIYHLDPANVGNAAGTDPGPSAAASTASRLPSRPSIAVLPFSNLGGHEEDGYFADGISEDIITELSRFKELIVTARNSTFTYRGQAVDVRQVSRDLHVRYVLEGSVRRAGRRLRVTAQLIDAESGHHLWAERFDRDLEDIFDVQDELTRRIVASLVDKLDDHEFRRLRADPGTGTPEAYELVLRGRELWFRFNREDNLIARDMYREAIALDPDYARAYASLAWSHILAYNEYWSGDPQGELDAALEHAQTGVRLAPTSHTNRLALGWVYYFRKQLPRAIEALRTAVDLNPNDADGYVFLAQSLSLNGENDRAIALLDEALRMNPHLEEWPRSVYVIAYFNARRYAEAIDVFERLESPRVEHMRWAAGAYAYLGRDAEAARAVARYLEKYPDFDLDLHLARIPFARAEDLEHYGEGLRRAGLVGVSA